MSQNAYQPGQNGPGSPEQHGQQPGASGPWGGGQHVARDTSQNQMGGSSSSSQHGAQHDGSGTYGFPGPSQAGQGSGQGFHSAGGSSGFGGSSGIGGGSPHVYTGIGRDHSSFAGQGHGGATHTMGNPWGGASQQGHQGHQGDDLFDPDYHQWRMEQLRAFDEDYRQWRQDRFRRFSDEFNQWRQGRQQPGRDATSGLGQETGAHASEGRSTVPGGADVFGHRRQHESGRAVGRRGGIRWRWLTL